MLKREEKAGMDFISGESRGQLITPPDRVGDCITDNNSARVVEAHADSLDAAALVRGRSEPNAAGRPMHDPKNALKLYLYGYMSRTRLSRRLEEESGRNPEALRLPGERSPEHKTMAEFRRRNGGLLKSVFKGFVKPCVRLGLYGKELAAIGGGECKAVGGKERSYSEGKLRERKRRTGRKPRRRREERGRNQGCC